MQSTNQQTITNHVAYRPIKEKQRTNEELLPLKPFAIDEWELKTTHEIYFSFNLCVLCVNFFFIQLVCAVCEKKKFTQLVCAVCKTFYSLTAQLPIPFIKL